MRRSISTIVLLFLAACTLPLATTAFGDSIRIDGEEITGIKIFEMSTLYYFRMPDGTARSVSKDAIGPNDIVFGDGPFPDAVDAIPAQQATPVEGSAPKETTEAEGSAPKEMPEAEGSAPKEMSEGTAIQAGAALRPLDAEGSAGLEINALALAAGEGTAVFAVIDKAAIGGDLAGRVQALLEERGSACASADLYLAATGMHTGVLPGSVAGVLLEVLLGDVDQAAMDAEAAAFADVIETACAAMAPAALRFAGVDAPDHHTIRADSSSSPDSTASILHVEDASGEPMAMLANYAIVPPATYGAEAVPSRGIPGAFATAVREATRADLPVLFYNGAAGDITATASDDMLQTAAGQSLATDVLAAIESAAPVSEAALASAITTTTLPASIVADIVGLDVSLGRLQLGSAVFFAAPLSPASQAGLLLRTAGNGEGIDHVFVLSHTLGYKGFAPSTEEYFAGSPSAMLAFHGPLMTAWIAENLLPTGEDAQPAWSQLPALAANEMDYQRGVTIGMENRETIESTWTDSVTKLRIPATLLLSTGQVPAEFQPLVTKLPDDAKIPVALQAAAIYLRNDSEPYTSEQRAMLMGVAVGSEMPFDAVYLLQVLAQPGSLPQQVGSILGSLQLTGFDTFAQ